MEACNWPVRSLDDNCLPSPEDGGQLPSEEQELIDNLEQMAADLLWNWTRRRFGVCPVTVRPCRIGCGSDYSTYYGPVGGGRAFEPVLIGGTWYNISCGACGTACSCRSDSLASINLPGPVQSVSSVWLDGELLDASEYRVEGSRRLVRVGGRWPMCQNLDAAEDEPGSFVIEYERGTPVPLGGQYAAGTLVCELFKAANGDDECQLPERVQSVTRQGVSMAILDAFEGLEEGRTGIWSIDSWTSSVNAPARPRVGVRSPDYRR